MNKIFSLFVLMLFSCSLKAELYNLSPTFDVENEFKIGSYVFKTPEKLKVYTYFRDDYWLFNVAKYGQYLFTAYIGNHPDKSLFEGDPRLNQTSFKLDHYPDINVSEWSCATDNQLKCSQIILFFNLGGGVDAIQFFYGGLNPETAKFSNSIIQTIKGPDGITPKTK